MAKLIKLWQSSLLFRRITSVSVFALAALLVSLGSHFPRSVSLPLNDLNDRSETRVAEEQIVILDPVIAPGDLALSYVGNKNEIADMWIDNATLDEQSRHLLFPGAAPSPPARIGYTTGPTTGPVKFDDTCHTTIEIRRTPDAAALRALNLYQTDQMAGAQRFRQLVMNAGQATLTIEVHTDSPTEGVMNLPGCHKLLSIGETVHLDLPPIPIRIVVHGGKIDLHFSPANPALPIFTGRGQTFEAVSLGDNTLRGRSLQVIPTDSSRVPLLEVRAARAQDSITLSHLKLGSESMKLEIGRLDETAFAYVRGVSIYNYDPIAAIQNAIHTNPLLSLAVGAALTPFLVPALVAWVKKNCFPAQSEKDRTSVRPE